MVGLKLPGLAAFTFLPVLTDAVIPLQYVLSYLHLAPFRVLVVLTDYIRVLHQSGVEAVRFQVYPGYREDLPEVTDCRMFCPVLA